jgi:hypothetical protein
MNNYSQNNSKDYSPSLDSAVQMSQNLVLLKQHNKDSQGLVANYICIALDSHKYHFDI